MVPLSDMLANVAMIVHRDWWDGFLDGTYFETLLVSLFLASVSMFVILFRRRLPLRPPFYSQLLLLALGPFITCALILAIRTLQIMHAESGGPLANFAEKRQDAVRPVLLGAAVSLVLVTIYVSAYVRANPAVGKR